MSIDKTPLENKSHPSFLGDVKRNILWSQDEIDLLLNYEEADDSETLDERLDFARYMLHYESGFNFPSRSLFAVKKKFYEECKNRRAGF